MVVTLSPLFVVPGSHVMTPWHTVAQVDNVRDTSQAVTIIELVGGLSFRVPHNKTVAKVIG